MRMPTLFGAALAVVLSATAISAQTPPPPPAGGGMDMAKMHAQMMADMKAADTKLDALVADMNKATGAARLDAAIAVINELARQKKAMSDKMEHMHQHMVQMQGTEKPAVAADPHKH